MSARNHDHGRAQTPTEGAEENQREAHRAPQVLSGNGPLRLVRYHVHRGQHASGAPRGRLQQLPPVLHGQADHHRHCRPGRALPASIGALRPRLTHSIEQPRARPTAVRALLLPSPLTRCDHSAWPARDRNHAVNDRHARHDDAAARRPPTTLPPATTPPPDPRPPRPPRRPTPPAFAAPMKTRASHRAYRHTQPSPGTPLEPRMKTGSAGQAGTAATDRPGHVQATSLASR